MHHWSHKVLSPSFSKYNEEEFPQDYFHIVVLGEELQWPVPLLLHPMPSGESWVNHSSFKHFRLPRVFTNVRTRAHSSLNSTVFGHSAVWCLVLSPSFCKCLQDSKHHLIVFKIRGSCYKREEPEQIQRYVIFISNKAPCLIM